MPDPSPSSAPPRHPLWRALKGFLLGRNGDASLRESIEEALDEHESDAPGDDLSPVERQMLKNLLHFGERTVDEVGVPRADIIGFEVGGSFAALVEAFAEAGHSRMPVYRDRLDSVIGMVHVKDVYAHLARAGAEAPVAAEALLRPVLFVPQSMRVLDLLARMRSQRTHMAVIVDEFGGTDGLVTIEDIVEEIVGDIEDEHDEQEAGMLVAAGDGFEADARVEVADVERAIGANLADPDEDVDTLGGIVFLLAGRVPAVGEVVRHPSGWRFEVVGGDDRKVTRLRIHPPEQSALDPAPVQ